MHACACVYVHILMVTNYIIQLYSEKNKQNIVHEVSENLIEYKVHYELKEHSQFQRSFKHLG